MVDVELGLYKMVRITSGSLRGFTEITWSKIEGTTSTFVRVINSTVTISHYNANGTPRSTPFALGEHASKNVKFLDAGGNIVAWKILLPSTQVRALMINTASKIRIEAPDGTDDTIVVDSLRIALMPNPFTWQLERITTYINRILFTPTLSQRTSNNLVLNIVNNLAQGSLLFSIKTITSFGNISPTDPHYIISSNNWTREFLVNDQLAVRTMTLRIFGNTTDREVYTQPITVNLSVPVPPMPDTPDPEPPELPDETSLTIEAASFANGRMVFRYQINPRSLSRVGVTYEIWRQYGDQSTFVKVGEGNLVDLRFSFDIPHQDNILSYVYMLVKIPDESDIRSNVAIQRIVDGDLQVASEISILNRLEGTSYFIDTISDTSAIIILRNELLIGEHVNSYGIIYEAGGTEQTVEVDNVGNRDTVTVELTELTPNTLYKITPFVSHQRLPTRLNASEFVTRRAFNAQTTDDEKTEAIVDTIIEEKVHSSLAKELKLLPLNSKKELLQSLVGAIIMTEANEAGSEQNTQNRGVRPERVFNQGSFSNDTNKEVVDILGEAAANIPDLHEDSNGDYEV